MKCLNKYKSSIYGFVDYDILKKEYLNGKSLRQICIEYGVARGGFVRHLKQDGIEILGNNKNQTPRHILKCNEDFFEVIDSEDKAYIMGFFLADGSFIKNGIKFDQNIDDVGILYYIKKSIQTESEVKTYNSKITDNYVSRPMCRLLISYIKLREDLLNKGFNTDKTYSFNKIECPSYLWADFIRGYLDGDGSIIYCDKSFSINITIKNKDTTYYIKEKTKEYLDIDFNVRYDTNKDCYTLYISNYKNAKKFNTLIYHPNYVFCLERKHDKLKKILGN